MEHIGIDSTSAIIALLVGDPGRVEKICKYFDNERILTTKRGYVVAEVETDKVKLLVVSTGIGSPSMAIAVEELFLIGVRIFIRIGTCGAIKETLKPGSIILSTAAVRDEGTSSHYIDVRYPAVSDMDLSAILNNHLRNFRGCFLKGITHSKDSFYSEKVEMQLSDEAGSHWRLLKSAGVLATDMETSCLYVIANLRGAKASSIIVTVGEDKDDNRIKEAFDYIFSILRRIVSEIEGISDHLYDEQSSPINRTLNSFLDKKNEK